MNRRTLLKALAYLPFIGFLRPLRSFAEAGAKKTFRLAFGSCCQQDMEQPFWAAIRDLSPDAFAFIGDNVYSDTEDMQWMRACYDQLGANSEFSLTRKSIPIIATWDDHDFGVNDGGREYSKKAESKNIMLDFFAEPKDSQRRQREGVYTSYIYGDKPHRVQVILLDLRWFRSPLISNGSGGYVPNPDPSAELLGAEQWKWLEQQLQVPAEFRILASSSQFISSEHRWEKWANFPLEKNRLHALIDKFNLKNLVVISGDMHFAELSRETTPGGIEIYDLTSSGLTYYEQATEIGNSKRVFLNDQSCNFGLVTINWQSGKIELEARNEVGEILFGRETELQELAAF